MFPVFMDGVPRSLDGIPSSTDGTKLYGWYQAPSMVPYPMDVTMLHGWYTQLDGTRFFGTGTDLMDDTIFMEGIPCSLNCVRRLMDKVPGFMDGIPRTLDCTVPRVSVLSGLKGV